jgi:hypothetical protein
MESCYFTAVDDATALGSREHGGPLAGTTPGAVDARGVIPLLAMPQLLALARGDEPVLDLGLVSHLWPRMPADPHADRSWMAEPVLERLADRLRDDLAAIDAGRAAELAARWAPVIHWPVEECEALVRDLVALATRARDEGRPLYGWYRL